MSRGEMIQITRTDAIARMLGMLCAVPVPPTGSPADAGQRPIEYRLDDSGRLGGYNPSKNEPWSWSYGNRTPTMDCVGAVFGAIGHDRRAMAAHFPEFSGDMNCESVMAHAKNTKRMFRVLEDGEQVLAGDIALTPGVRTILGRKPGHMELVVRPPTKHNPVPLLMGNSPRHKKTGPQSLGAGAPWSKSVVYVRYLGFVNDENARGKDAQGNPYPQFTGPEKK